MVCFRKRTIQCCCTGPTGATGPAGASAPVSFLAAYSTPPQTGTTGTTLIFDRNASQAGNDISHNQNSSQVTIQTPGYYDVSFNGIIGPLSNSVLPLTTGFYLIQNGNTVSGAAAQHTFQNASDTASLSFSQIVSISSVPAILQIKSQGGNFAYSSINITVQKIGNLTNYSQ